MKQLKTLALLAISCCWIACGGGGSDIPSPEPEAPENEETPVTPTPTPTPTITDFAKGADISWLTEMEADGVKFRKANGTEADCYDVLKEAGVNAIRLRVWVDSSKSPYQTKACHKEAVVQQAQQAKKAGMEVMIDFHYSDWFADPGRQEIPADWKNKSLADLKIVVADYTKEVLEAVKSAGVTPKWIQIGNETRNGMLHPNGQLWDDKGDIANGWKNYVMLHNAGYDAAKGVCPDACVMVHQNNAYENIDWWFKKFQEAGGKMDMIGLSHYPMTNDAKKWSEMNTLAVQYLKQWSTSYGVKVMICEVGVKPAQTDAVDCLKDFMQKLAKQKEHTAGVFYWEPQVYGGWKPASYTSLGWNAYDMGAFTTKGEAGDIMKALCADY